MATIRKRNNKLGDSSRAFSDDYALTQLIKWVWRSRVRKGASQLLFIFRLPGFVGYFKSGCIVATKR